MTMVKHLIKDSDVDFLDQISKLFILNRKHVGGLAIRLC